MSMIFYVDDDLMMFNVFEKVFKKSKHDVFFNKDGEGVVEKLLAMNPRPDIILLDMVMPKLSGLEILSMIKNKPELESIPVICFSNLAEPENIKKAKSLGAVRYLIKSDYDPFQVLSVIEEVIKKSK